MKSILTGTIFAALVTPALADDRALLTQHEQQLCDAATNGARAVWDKYLDSDVIFVKSEGEPRPSSRVNRRPRIRTVTC